MHSTQVTPGWIPYLLATPVVLIGFLLISLGAIHSGWMIHLGGVVIGAGASGPGWWLIARAFR